jgi:CheY-like chemotaxis protein
MKSNGRILVVDDNLMNRIVLSTSLKERDYDVAMAEDGSQALEMLASQAFDVVLLDLIMPGLDGFQVLEKMKADSAQRDIPVIVISARLNASLVAKRLRDIEREYLEQVDCVTSAATAVEAGAFELNSLDCVAARDDALGKLARVFQNMARQVYAREQNLRQQVQELRIEIDEVKKARQVAEIIETDYFRDLRAKADRLRRREETNP